MRNERLVNIAIVTGTIITMLAILALGFFFYRKFNSSANIVAQAGNSSENVLGASTTSNVINNKNDAINQLDSLQTLVNNNAQQFYADNNHLNNNYNNASKYVTELAQLKAIATSSKTTSKNSNPIIQSNPRLVSIKQKADSYIAERTDSISKELQYISGNSLISSNQIQGITSNLSNMSSALSGLKSHIDSITDPKLIDSDLIPSAYSIFNYNVYELEIPKADIQAYQIEATSLASSYSQVKTDINTIIDFAKTQNLDSQLLTTDAGQYNSDLDSYNNDLANLEKDTNLLIAQNYPNTNQSLINIKGDSSLLTTDSNKLSNDYSKFRADFEQK